MSNLVFKNIVTLVWELDSISILINADFNWSCYGLVLVLITKVYIGQKNTVFP